MHFMLQKKKFTELIYCYFCGLSMNKFATKYASIFGVFSTQLVACSCFVFFI